MKDNGVKCKEASSQDLPIQIYLCEERLTEKLSSNLWLSEKPCNKRLIPLTRWSWVSVTCHWRVLLIMRPCCAHPPLLTSESAALRPQPSVPHPWPLALGSLSSVAGSGPFLQMPPGSPELLGGAPKAWCPGPTIRA